MYQLWISIALQAEKQTPDDYNLWSHYLIELTLLDITGASSGDIVTNSHISIVKKDTQIRTLNITPINPLRISGSSGDRNLSLHSYIPFY